MEEHLQISIPTPCPEKWSSFEKTRHGGFCSSCQKEVIDFTSWSDAQLILYFKNPPARTCGRLREGQLKIYSYEDIRRKRPRWLSISLASILLLFTSRELSAQPATRQTTEQFQPIEGVKDLPKSMPVPITITGVVRSKEDQSTLPGVHVLWKGTVVGTSTDAAGKFSLTLPDSVQSRVLVFSYIGCRTVEYTPNVAQPGRDILIEMAYDVIMLGGLESYRRVSPRRFWARIKSLF
jgi:hypothetical protein